MSSYVFERVRAMLVDKLGVAPEKVHPDSTLVELGADSLDVADIIIDLEEAFNIEIPDRDADNLQTVYLVVRYIDGRIKK